MTDRRTDADAPRKSGRRIPPLVWILLVMLAGWAVVAFMQRGGTDVTPQGGTHPVQAEGPSVMPPAPAQGDAPATPGGVVNNPTPADKP